MFQPPTSPTSPRQGLPLMFQQPMSPTSPRQCRTPVSASDDGFDRPNNWMAALKLETTSFDRYLRSVLEEVADQLIEAHEAELSKRVPEAKTMPLTEADAPVNGLLAINGTRTLEKDEADGVVDASPLSPGSSACQANDEAPPLACHASEKSDPVLCRQSTGRCSSGGDTVMALEKDTKLTKFWLNPVRYSQEHSEYLGGALETLQTVLKSCLPNPRREGTLLARLQKRFEATIESVGFETFFGILILLNTVTMSVEVQCRGLDTGYELGYKNSPDVHPQAYAAVKLYLELLETVFGALFTVEVTFKLFAQKCAFFKSAWNYFDTTVIAFWLVDQVFRAALIINPMILRLCRLARLLRLMRLVRMIQLFDSLHLLIGAIKASCSVLLWSMVLLLVTMIVCGLCFNQVLQPFLMDMGMPEEHRLMIYGYFGTTTRAIITMFEITLANWSPPTRALVDYVNEWFGLVVLTYRVLIGFAVINVISGVFLHETFKVASSNDDLMIIQRERTSQQHVAKMKRLFFQADTNSDGLISKDEFLELFDDRRVVQWLAAMELQTRDGATLFELLSNGKDTISPEELVTNAGALKGSARSIDLATLINLTDRLKRVIRDINRKVDRLSQDRLPRVGGHRGSRGKNGGSKDDNSEHLCL